MPPMSPDFTPHLPLTLSAVPGPYRVADYMEYEGEERCELIFGRLYVTPSPACLHQIVTGSLFAHFLDVARSSGGLALIAPVDVILAEHSVVQPDVLYLSQKNRGIATDRIRGTPDLLVEVLSPTSGRRDRMAKRKLYASAGVPEYWIVDPQAQQIDIFHLEGERYLVFELEHSTYSSAACPEIELDMESFWSEVQRMAPEAPSD